MAFIQGRDRLFRAHHTREWIPAIGLATWLTLMWMLRHGYEGIIHDAQLYSFRS